MFLDAAAIVAMLSDEAEAERCAAALIAATDPITSAIAVWEAAVALARPDKLAVALDITGPLVLRFLEERGVQIRDLPEAGVAVTLALDAARRFRSGPIRLNLADCFHYACPATTTSRSCRRQTNSALPTSRRHPEPQSSAWSYVSSAASSPRRA
jgi:ribonuclease VapC